MQPIILRQSVKSINFRSIRQWQGLATLTSPGTRTQCSAVERTIEAVMATDDFQNFRDLNSASAKLKSGLIFRCACPVKATEDDMRIIVNDLNITCMLDLRADEEIKEFGRAPVLDGAKLVVHQRVSQGWFSPVKMGYTLEELPGSPTHTPIRVHHVSILDRPRFVRALLKRLPLRTVAASALYKVFDSKTGTEMLMKEVNGGGLKWLYEIILETSRPEFGQALRVILGAVEEGRSIMFFCKAGKDRTGLLALLLLKIVGATDEEIIADYHISDAQGLMALADLQKRDELKTLDREIFSRAPRQAMVDALAYISAKYGSVETYLEGCSFTLSEQKRLRELLLAP